MRYFIESVTKVNVFGTLIRGYHNKRLYEILLEPEVSLFPNTWWEVQRLVSFWALALEWLVDAFTEGSFPMRSHKPRCFIGFLGYSFLRSRWEKRVLLVKPNTRPLTAAIQAQSTWLILGTTLTMIITRATGGKKSWPPSAGRGKERSVVQRQGNNHEYNITSPLKLSVMNEIYNILWRKNIILLSLNFLFFRNLWSSTEVQAQFSGPKPDRWKTEKSQRNSS